MLCLGVLMAGCATTPPPADAPNPDVAAFAKRVTIRTQAPLTGLDLGRASRAPVVAGLVVSVPVDVAAALVDDGRAVYV